MEFYSCIPTVLRTGPEANPVPSQTHFQVRTANDTANLIPWNDLIIHRAQSTCKLYFKYAHSGRWNSIEKLL